jgi:hypothetical protein
MGRLRNKGKKKRIHFYFTSLRPWLYWISFDYQRKKGGDREQGAVKIGKIGKTGSRKGGSEGRMKKNDQKKNEEGRREECVRKEKGQREKNEGRGNLTSNER